MAPPMIFITLCTWGEVENDLLVFGLGGVAFAAGLFIRLWSQTHLRYRLHIKTTLTRTGPYAYVRNPIYIGNTFILVGACLLAEMFWFAPIQLLYCAIIYSLVVRYEEAHLAEKYGVAYLDYVKRVPRWLPKLLRPESTRANVTQYLGVSTLAEAHNLLFLLPFIIKEFVAA